MLLEAEQLFNRDIKSSVDLLWKEHSENVGKVALFIAFGMMLIGFFDLSAFAVLFYSIIISIIASKTNQKWIVFPLAVFYGSAISSDGNPFAYAAMVALVCVLFAHFLTTWMLSVKSRGESIRERMLYLGSNDNKQIIEVKSI